MQTLEEPNLLTSYPSLRPGDLVLHSNLNPFGHQFLSKEPITAIDVTIVSPLLDFQTYSSTIQYANKDILKHHLYCESKNIIYQYKK